MMSFRLIALFLSVLLTALVGVGISQPKAQVVALPEQPGWCAFAQQYLRRPDGAAINCNTAAPGSSGFRCLRMLNYGCVKQRSPDRAGRPRPHPGTTWGGNTAGARDHDNHAVFDDPVMSGVAVLNIIRRYQVAGSRSALAIAERYSPWCDTLGSGSTKADNQGRVWFRTCDVSTSRIPRGALLCAKPANNAPPSAGQCQACNCPSRIAVPIARAGGASAVSDQEAILQPLELFAADGTPLPTASAVLRVKLRNEQGVVPTDQYLSRVSAGWVRQD